MSFKGRAFLQCADLEFLDEATRFAKSGDEPKFGGQGKFIPSVVAPYDSPVL